MSRWIKGPLPAKASAVCVEVSFHQVAHLAFCSPCCVKVCVCVSVHTCVHACWICVCVCVYRLWGLRGKGGGVQVKLCGYFATEGTVYRAHILTTLRLVFLNVSAQIFFQPSTVSTELTFLTRLMGFKRFFLQRQTHQHQFSGCVQLKTDLKQPQKCHRWPRALEWSD